MNLPPISQGLSDLGWVVEGKYLLYSGEAEILSISDETKDAIIKSARNLLLKVILIEPNEAASGFKVPNDLVAIANYDLNLVEESLPTMLSSVKRLWEKLGEASLPIGNISISPGSQTVYILPSIDNGRI